MQADDTRVVHITHEKCGSQWVKDVLTAPEVIRHSGLPYSGVSLNLGGQRYLDLPPNTVSGPIYDMNRWEWAQWRKAGDKAIVVLRDPRDTVISLMYSWLYSHSSNIPIEARRQELIRLADDEARLASMIGVFASGARTFLTWTNAQDSSALVVRYEALICEQRAEFRKIFDWLGWTVPEDTLELVVERLDFKVRSGRTPGTPDVYSHYRNGIAGDWRNHFSKRSGQLWECMYPGLLCDTGYETGADWWQMLPDKSGEPSQLGDNSLIEERLITTLQKRNGFLEQDVEQKERMIRDLTNECEERSKVIRSLNIALLERTNECDERLTAINDLDGERVRLLAICEERLKAIVSLSKKRSWFR